MRACVVLSGDDWTRESVFECGRCHQGVQQSGGSCVLVLASFWLDLARYTGCRGSFSCLCFSSWDETARLICGGAIPHNKYRSSTLVGLRHPEMAPQAAFRTGSIFEACDDLLQTGDAYSAEEKHRAGVCGTDSSGVCSPIGVRQLLENAVPGSGLCLGLSNVVFVRDASVWSDS